MLRNKNEITTITPSAPSAIALPTSERKNQLQIALGEENWPQALSAAFPDVISQTDLTAQFEILIEISAANRRYKRWNKISNICFLGGTAGLILGTSVGRAEFSVAGVILVLGPSLLAITKGADENHRIKFDLSRWQNLQTHWWQRENR